MSDLALIDVPGGAVEVDDIPGDPALAPLLFLHEGLGSVALWRGFHHRIAAATGNRAVAYSRLGHSDGASIALIHAATHPVRGVVVLAPHVFVEPAGLVGIVAARTAFTTGDLRARMARRHRDADTTFWNWNDVWLSDEFRAWDLRPLLDGITAPVLAVQGTADPYGTVAHVEDVRAAAAGPVELLVLDCGHAPHLERPDDVEPAVVAFLREMS